RTAYSSVCHVAVLPMQDLLGLGPEGRFNTPGKPEGNWRWRLAPGDMERLGSGGTAAYLASLATLTGRTPAAGGAGDRS
ncbi:MAG TPA: 4-alpha-glucanotransferase, partial [Opitutaceae bacterium]